MGILAHTVQNGAFVIVGGVIRKQRIRVAVQCMACIALHHDARLAGKAELRHYGVQIRRIDKGTGHQQHFAAVFQIGLQLRDLVHKTVGGKIRSRRIDDQQPAVLWDGAC